LKKIKTFSTNTPIKFFRFLSFSQKRNLIKMPLNIKLYFRSGNIQLLERVNYTEELRKQLNEKGVRSFGSKKEDDYYLKRSDAKK